LTDATSIDAVTFEAVSSSAVTSEASNDSNEPLTLLMAR